MILVDFRNWSYGKLDFSSNTQKELLQRDFESILNVGHFDVLDLGNVKPFDFSNLFFENLDTLAISPVKNMSNYYETIDAVVELKNKEVVDYTEAADEEVFFYGVNSLIAHLGAEIALCGINEFTDESLFEEYCEDFELTPFSFDLPEGMFTRDIALFAGNTLLICLEYLKDKKLKKDLFSFLKNNDLEMVTFTKNQAERDVFNMKYIEGKLLITEKVNLLLTADQKEKLRELSIEVLKLPFLDKVGVSLRNIII